MYKMESWIAFRFPVHLGEHDDGQIARGAIGRSRCSPLRERPQRDPKVAPANAPTRVSPKFGACKQIVDHAGWGQAQISVGR